MGQYPAAPSSPGPSVLLLNLAWKFKSSGDFGEFSEASVPQETKHEKTSKLGGKCGANLHAKFVMKIRFAAFLT